MLNVEIKEIGGFTAMLQALHLPFGGKVKSSTEFDMTPTIGVSGCIYSCVFCVNDADLKLLQKLVKAGPEHAKVLRGVVVWAEINAPRYWWAEMDTYRHGTERLSSESTMHIQGRGLSTEELVKMKSELPEGTMQKRAQFFSYQALRNIYKQRRAHRLPEWHTFCEWIERLPFAAELITNGIKEEE